MTVLFSTVAISDWQDIYRVAGAALRDESRVGWRPTCGRDLDCSAGSGHLVHHQLIFGGNIDTVVIRDATEVNTHIPHEECNIKNTVERVAPEIDKLQCCYVDITFFNRNIIFLTMEYQK